jgi:hypothetical protein
MAGFVYILTSPSSEFTLFSDAQVLQATIVDEEHK